MEAYVTNLAKYTEGQLVGKWLEFPIDEDDFMKELESIGVSEGGEWFVTDYDSEKGEPYEALGEYPSIDDLNEFAEIAERYFDYDAFARDLSFGGYTETENGVIIID